MKVQGNSLQELLASMTGSSVGQTGETQTSGLELLLGTSESGEEATSEQLAEEFLGQLEQQGIDVSELLDQSNAIQSGNLETAIAESTGAGKNNKSKVLDQLMLNSKTSEVQLNGEPQDNSALSAQLKSILSKGIDGTGAQKLPEASSVNGQPVNSLNDGQMASKLNLGGQGDVLKFKLEGKNSGKFSGNQQENLKVKNLDGEASVALLNPSDRPQMQVMMKSAMNSYVKNNGDAPVVKNQFKSFEDAMNGMPGNSNGNINNISAAGQANAFQSPAQNILNKASVATGISKNQAIELRGNNEQTVNQVSNYILQMRTNNMDSAQVYFKHNELGDIKIMAEKMKGKDEIMVSIQTSQAGTQNMLKDHQTELVRALHDGGFKMAEVKITQMPVSASSEMSKNTEGGDFSKDFSREQSQSSGFSKEGQSSQFERRQESDRRKNLWNDAYERMEA
jgi:hypothetical protein